MLTTLPWCTGKAECLACEHEWIAVWPLGANDLECPNCGGRDTVRESLPAPPGETN